jgi:TolB protein
MAKIQINEIRRAYELGDIENARLLIHEALNENPTPQLYRLAAEIAPNQDQKIYFLKKAKALDVTQASKNILSTRSENKNDQSCPYCGALSPIGTLHCRSCGRSPNIDNTPAAPTPAVDRGVNKTRIVFGIILLVICLWAVGLVFAGMYIFTNNSAFRSRPDLTSTAFALLISTPKDFEQPTTIPFTDSPADTAIPTKAVTSSPPTETAAPDMDRPELKVGRVTTENYNFYNPAISPRHQAIAASIEINGNWQVVEIDPATGLISREITDQEHIYTNPHYSNDGQYFLLRADINGFNNIYLADAVTGEIIQTLTDYTESIGYPRWMPDGRSFLYKRYRNEAAEIFVGYLDGSSPTQLTSNNRYDGSPASSPDGRTIAMSSFINGNYEIVILDRETGTFRQLTFDSGRDSEPVFSPDGGWIAFESDRGGDYNIWVIHPDSSGLKQVTFDNRNELIPAFSPGGGWLYFQQQQENGDFSINRIPWP